MSNLSPAQRHGLPAFAFADPQTRTHPILDQADVDRAALLVDRSKNADALRSRLSLLAHAKGLSVPWDEVREETPDEEIAAAATALKSNLDGVFQTLWGS